MSPKRARRKHCCKHCNKSFPSGVSLGGHMRCHMHTEQPKSTPSPPATPVAAPALVEKRARTPQLLHSDKEPPPPSDTQCPSCGKVFSSCKALWGHMRTHSEKKRVQEQEPARKVSPLRNGDGEDVMLMIPVKRKRSKSMVLGSSLSPAVLKCGTEEVEAALTLMMMSRDKSCPGPFLPVGVDSVKNSATVDYGRGCNEDGNSVSYVKTEAAANANASVHGLIGDVEFKKTRTANSDEENMPPKLSAEGISGHQASGGALKQALEKRDRFECVTCKKPSASYRAHGSHRTGHEMFKGSAALEAKCSEGNGMEKVAPACGKLKTEPVFREVCIKLVNARSHECELCGKAFPSGQALGGHKRCHYVPGCSSSRNANSVPFQQQKQQFELNSDLLDLNVPALTDGECAGTSARSELKPLWPANNLQWDRLDGAI